MNISDKWKKILFAAVIIVAIELSGYGIFASFFRLLGSVSPWKLKGGLIIANHPDINCNNEFMAVFKVIKLDIEGKPCFVMFKNRN